MSKQNQEKKNKFKYKPLAVIALALCALAIIYSATSAWLTGVVLNPGRLVASIEDFKYETYVSFDGTNWSKETEPIIVSIDSDDNNCIGNLRVSIRQVGNGVAFMRVKITHEWGRVVGGNVVSRYQGDLNLPFNFSGSFLDNRDNDGFVYYCNSNAPESARMHAFPIGNNNTEFITGFDATNFDTTAVTDSSIRLSINITVDAVQFNRYQQVWGVNSKPWLG